MTDTRPQCIAFIATSLDGFIARTDDELDWLMNAVVPEDEDFGYQQLYDSVDALVMGRGTLQAVAAFDHWPYEGKRVIVLSRTLTSVPENLKGKIELTNQKLDELLSVLYREGCRKLYIDGGKTIQSFINASLLDEITITRIPVLLGEGKPLFGKTQNDVALKHVETKSFENGFVSSTYHFE